MRGGSRVSFHQFVTLNKLLFRMGGLLVMCDAPLGAILETWRGRAAAEYVKDEDKLGEIVESYGVLTERLTRQTREPGRLHVYDFTEHMGSAGERARKIVEE